MSAVEFFKAPLLQQRKGIGRLSHSWAKTDGIPCSSFGPVNRSIFTEVVAIDRFGTRPSWSIQ
jgi:hypothetical protein